MEQENHEISITRYIDVPPLVVWKVITERLSEWWCPLPWKAEFESVDWKAGSSFNSKVSGPDGEHIETKGVLLEVSPQRRMVFTDAMDADWNPQNPFLIGILELTPEGKGTRYRGLARHWNEESKKQHLDMGFEQGWSKVADQLAAFCEEAKD